MTRSSKPLTEILVSFWIIFLLTIPGLAQESAEEPAGRPEEKPILKVTATICTDVQDREPRGAGLAFPATVEKLYCHTLVEGAQEPITIAHAWYHDDRNVAQVSLEVGSSPWRTWSSKRIVESWTGAWRVDILDGTEKVLATISFQVQ
jgi:hypothetical protein